MSDCTCTVCGHPSDMPGKPLCFTCWCDALEPWRPPPRPVAPPPPANPRRIVRTLHRLARQVATLAPPRYARNEP